MHLALALETKLPESPSVTSLTSALHRDLAPWENLDDDILSVILPDSPVSPGGDGPVVSPVELPSGYGVDTCEDPSDVEAPETPIDPEGDTTLVQPEESIVLVPESKPDLPPPSQRLHCRMCRSEPCVDLTATMCGHVFCYKCVTLLQPMSFFENFFCRYF